MKKITQIAALSAALCISNTMEADDKMGTLTPKEQNIALAAAYAAKGDQNGLKGALAAGLDSGVSVNTRKCLCRFTLTADSRAASTPSEPLWNS